MRTNPEKIVEKRNKNYEIGMDVEVIKDDGMKIHTNTRSVAWMLGGHTPVILLDAIKGCYALERVTPFEGLEETNKLGNGYHRSWCQQNPNKVARMQKRWLDAHPSYSTNYMRERKGVSDALIFQFLDNGFGGGTVEEFITFLQAEGVPKQHIGWFKVDVRKELEKRGEEKGFGRRLHGFTQINGEEEGVGC